MSETDSFIEEVTEEVRKDQLYGYAKKYGWILGLLIVLVVGGAAYSEWSKSKSASMAQGRGDAILAALSLEDKAAQVSALDAILADAGDAAPVILMQKAALLADADDKAGAIAVLEQIIADPDAQSVYKDIAQFKALVLHGKDMEIEARKSALEALASTNSTMRPLALEQIVVAELDQGNKDAAMAQLEALLAEAGVTQTVRQRALQLLISLGGTPPAQTQLLSGN